MARTDLLAAEVPDDLASLRAATLALKRISREAFDTLVARPDGAVAAEARKLLAAVAERQSARERAWARMTGFPTSEASVATVLCGQAAPPTSSSSTALEQ
jgi:hypothetical protein